jgi:hypothetical protein
MWEYLLLSRYYNLFKKPYFTEYQSKETQNKRLNIVVLFSDKLGYFLFNCFRH